MSRIFKSAKDLEGSFSVAVREQREGKAARALRIENPAFAQKSEDRGSDPYNTSGGFDRKKNWARVGKR